jgi:hypothetical protein
MADAGYAITQPIIFEVDDKLPFMGYTTERENKTVIVVAQWALKTDMVMGLLIHELSHVYRTESQHPSHNFALHNQVLNHLFKNRHPADYQTEILHKIINNVQDLYADDISFAVYIKDAKKDSINEFFLGWVHPALPKITTVAHRWKSAELLLSAAFAKANLERHHIADKDDKITKAVNQFLFYTDPIQAKRFTEVKNMMVSFPETITDQAFGKLLTTYILTFLSLIEK